MWNVHVCASFHSTKTNVPFASANVKPVVEEPGTLSTFTEATAKVVPESKPTTSALRSDMFESSTECETDELISRCKPIAHKKGVVDGDKVFTGAKDRGDKRKVVAHSDSVCHGKKKVVAHSITKGKRKRRGHQDSFIKNLVQELQKSDYRYDDRIAKMNTARYGAGADEEPSSSEEDVVIRRRKGGKDRIAHKYIKYSASESSENDGGKCLVDTDSDPQHSDNNSR